MKIMVSTHATQGQRPRQDFCWAADGEPVYFPFECDGERVDGACGCRRSMAGAYTHKSTTTFTVIDSDQWENAEQLARHIATNGFGADMALTSARDALELAARLEAGKVYERRGERIYERRVA